MKGQSQRGAEPSLHIIIPAGGAGTRLWPLSRAGKPKFLLDLLGEDASLLQTTILRLLPLARSITVVTGRAHEDAVVEQIQVLREQKRIANTTELFVAVEPAPRDSMPAIGLAVALIKKRYGRDAVIGSFAADHAIRNENEFRTAARLAIGAAQSGFLTTIGLIPASASSAYGYIEPTTTEISPGAYLARRFVEKPPVSIAAEYVSQGYLWNAGMFVIAAGALMAHLEELHPEMEATLTELAELWEFAPRHGGTVSTTAIDKPEQALEVDRLWSTLPRIAIDHALAEPVAAKGGVAVVAAPSTVGWSDVGDFPSLADVLAEQSGPDLRDSGTVPPAGKGEASTEEIIWDSPGALVIGQPGKTTVVIGVEQAIVVDTDDALLVTTMQQGQRVKDVVDALKSQGKTQLL